MLGEENHKLSRPFDFTTGHFAFEASPFEIFAAIVAFYHSIDLVSYYFTMFLIDSEACRATGLRRRPSAPKPFQANQPVFATFLFLAIFLLNGATFRVRAALARRPARRLTSFYCA